MKIPTHLAVVAAFCLPLASLMSADPEQVDWEPLITSDTISGWKQLGGAANYEVKDGVVTGSSVRGTPNSFLATEKEYGDFILEYEFKVDESLNSGVQIRSNSLPSYKNGQVHGYQVEIDPDVEKNRMWTGGIYDEGRRGWLYDLSKNDAAREAFKPNEWNRIRVEAIADRIRTWVNDVPAADLIDSMTMTGFIALQVHSVGDREELEGLQVQWRDLRIKDLGKHVWKPLFNGKDLSGWTASPGGEWQVKDGVIVGTSPAEEPRHGILFSDDSYGDFSVRMKFRVVEGDSGFYFRVKKQLDEAVSVSGFQVEVDTSNETGGLYETGGRAWVVQPDPALIEKIYKPGEWSDLSLSARGGDIYVSINHQRTAELIGDQGNQEGYFGLQLHGGERMEVYFNEIEMLVPEDPVETE